jgi:GTP cyclohydrolase FolE2
MKTFIDNEWDESSQPPKRPKFIEDMIREGERIQDETEKRIANFMLECKS